MKDYGDETLLMLYLMCVGECSRCPGPLIFYFIGSNSTLGDTSRTATSQEGSQVQRDSFSPPRPRPLLCDGDSLRVKLSQVLASLAIDERRFSFRSGCSRVSMKLFPFLKKNPHIVRNMHALSDTEINSGTNQKHDAYRIC